MIYTRKQIDYWRVDARRLLYCYSNWAVLGADDDRIPGSTLNLYEDSVYLHNDQLFLQVL